MLNLHKTPATTLATALALASLLLPVSASVNGDPDADQRVIEQNNKRSHIISQALESIELPEGFEISLYALVPNAHRMAVSPDGRLVIVGTLRAQLWAIENHQGQALSVRSFGSGIKFKFPNGPCFDSQGRLYITERNRIMRFLHPVQQQALAVPKAEVLVPQGQLIPPQFESNVDSARNCHIGSDGDLYVSLGQARNTRSIEHLDEYDRLGIGGTLRFDLQNGGREVYAYSSSVDDIYREEITSQKTSNHPSGALSPAIDSRSDNTDFGQNIYTGSRFPKRYHGGVFSTQQSSQDRSEPIAARVLFSSVNAQGDIEHSDIFASGWIGKNGEYWGRPVDVLMLNDGSLLVSDDYANAIYRIRYQEN